MAQDKSFTPDQLKVIRERQQQLQNQQKRNQRLQVKSLKECESSASTEHPTVQKERLAKEKIPNAFELSMEKLQKVSSKDLQQKHTARSLIDRSQIHCDYLLRFQGQTIKRNQVLQNNLKLNEMRERVKTTLDYCNQSQHFVTLEKQHQKSHLGGGAHECT